MSARAPEPGPSPAHEKFGALVYRTRNLGDEIQTLAALRFLPRVDYLVDRDNLASFSEADRLSMILNGWFGERPNSWPPSKSIRPLLVSFHLSPMRGTLDLARLAASDFFLREPAIRYLRQNGPVGARDLHTLELLERHQVPAYFSGCLTLTLQRSPEAVPGEDIVLNDVPDEVLPFIKRNTRRNVVVNTHLDFLTPEGEPRLARARGLLELYQSAHLVITTRLHCALPCLAMGTKVVLLKVDQEPTRFGGLERLVRTASLAELLAGRVVDLERPEPNGSDHLGLRATLQNTVTQFLASPVTRPPVEPGDLPAELRAQTLLALYVESLKTQEGLRLEVDRSQKELEAARQEFGRMSASLSASLNASLTASMEEKAGLQGALVQLDEEVKKMRASTSWHLAEAMWTIAARFPRAAGPLRDLLKRLT